MEQAKLDIITTFLDNKDHSVTLSYNDWASLAIPFTQKGTAQKTLTQMCREANINATVRYKYISNFSFPIISTELVDTLAEQLKGQKVLDIGCGLGYLAYNLKVRGIDITAMDHWDAAYMHHLFEDLSKIEIVKKKIDDVTIEELSQYDAVIITWPCYDTPFAETVVTKMLETNKQQTLIHCGEDGGCTGSEAFEGLLECHPKITMNIMRMRQLNKYALSFLHIRDFWTVYTIGATDETI